MYLQKNQLTSWAFATHSLLSLVQLHANFGLIVPPVFAHLQQCRDTVPSIIWQTVLVAKCLIKSVIHIIWMPNYYFDNSFQIFKISACSVKLQCSALSAHLQHTLSAPSGHLQPTFRAPSAHLQRTFSTRSAHHQRTFSAYSAHIQPALLQRTFSQRTFSTQSVHLQWFLEHLQYAFSANWAHLQCTFIALTVHTLDRFFTKIQKNCAKVTLPIAPF